ncbi:MAG: RagB/SusD family nutrient uptake outer membrane protein [Bacteroidales bacterium]|nr:RagB/SusD family nutrient uptake outer membrane protein [Bacteroidales bacterium]
MKSYFSKIFTGAALLSLAGFASCTGDLDQLPQDPNSTTAVNFAENPREYIGGVMAKCYSSLAVSGQGGPNGDADISGLDGGTSQWTRTIFMLEEFPTDENLWLYDDGGVDEMRWATWGSANVAIFGTYSRLYTHIAVCNDFIRLTRELGDYGIEVGGTGDTAISQAEIDQFVLEARALRDLSYYYVIDFFGNAVVAWDDMAYGEIPPQTTRLELYNKVVEDLEDVLANFPDTTPVYGRIGKDAVEALLVKFYLNAEVYTGTAQWAKCYEHCKNIINRHQGGGYQGSGLANDYLSLFCASNKMFAPGGALTAQNEILWNIPQATTYCEPWGGSTFLVNAAIKNMPNTDFTKGYMNQLWYGTNDSWSCMHARKEFAELFDTYGDITGDKRTVLWLTESAGFSIENVPYNEFQAGYASIKYTAVPCNSDGSMPIWDYTITDDNGLVLTLPRAGVADADGNVPYNGHHDTNVPVIRLAEIYLSAAECAYNGASGSSQSEGLNYVNLIRNRAGLGNITQLTSQALLDERARELYWENNRRTDLIRFGKWISGYNWSWKGGVQTGTNLPSHFNLYPLPSDVLATYGSAMTQNTGY